MARNAAARPPYLSVCPDISGDSEELFPAQRHAYAKVPKLHASGNERALVVTYDSTYFANVAVAPIDYTLFGKASVVTHHFKTSSGLPTVQAPKVEPHSPIHARLAAAEGESDRMRVGKLAHDLSDLCASPPGRTALQTWLTTEADRWVRQRRPALAAVIEAGARLAVPETVKVISSVLEDEEANLEVVSVAAQRIRRLNVEDPEQSSRLGALLVRRIDKWITHENTKQSALWALPSVPRLLWRTNLAWLTRRIAGDDDQVTWAVLQGVLDIAGTPTMFKDAEVADNLFEASHTRLESFLLREVAEEDQAGPDVAATLVWVLGAVCTEKNIERTAVLLRQVFDPPQGLRGAASVRAGKVLVQHWKSAGTRALLSAFDAQESIRARYISLLVTP